MDMMQRKIKKVRFSGAQTAVMYFYSERLSDDRGIHTRREIRQQVEKRLKTEERNRQLWGGKYTGKMRGN